MVMNSDYININSNNYNNNNNDNYFFSTHDGNINEKVQKYESLNAQSKRESMKLTLQIFNASINGIFFFF